ncbi:glycosyl hydrolase [Saccharopolyspora sp. NPDC049357]|uniref:glycosyl hydrolase n=1 Tax=Saccharopolyspora sp. NPDC049357 TaxID=3154507 RepID=UPI00343501A2
MRARRSEQCAANTRQRRSPGSARCGDRNWNVKDSSITGLRDYWPTDDRVDVASTDIWEKAAPSQADHDAMRQVAAGRPIALGEVGAVPAPELLDAQPDWSYFMLWAEYLDQNDPAEVQRTCWDDRVLVLDEMRR